MDAFLHCGGFHPSDVAVIIDFLRKARVFSPEDLVLLVGTDLPFVLRGLGLLGVSDPQPKLHRCISELANVQEFHRVSALPCRTACVTTGDRALDLALCGGYMCGTVSELVGEAGAGKTQLLLHSMCSVAAEHGALYLVSEDFPHTRLLQICEAVASHCQCTAEDILSRIIVRKVHGLEDLAVVSSPTQLEEVLRCSRVRAVYLDSIAAAVDDSSSPLIAAVGSNLRRVASSSGVAVVVSNQVRSSLTTGSLVPALGLRWSQCVHHRFFLARGSPRTISCIFSPNVKPFRLNFEVRREGIVSETS